MPKSLAQRIAADPALKAKYLANPGLRSKLPTAMLTPAQRRQRAANTQGAKPVTPGSSLTNRDLAREARAAGDVRYGPAQRELEVQRSRAEAQGRDMGAYYDQYQRELAQHSANTQAINAQALGAIGATAQSLQALDQGNLTASQQAADASAAQRGASAANQAPDASNASLVRQQALAGFANQQAMTGAATNRFADTKATVVAPTQKLQARAQSARDVRAVGDKLTGLAGDRGAFDTQYRAGRVGDEQKNVLAMKALGVDVTKATLASEDRRKQRVTANRNADASRQQSAATTAQRLALERERVDISRAKATAPDKTTKARSDKLLTSIRTAGADADYYLKLPVPVLDAQGKETGKTRPRTESETRKGLRDKYKDADVANAAMDLGRYGYILPARVRALQARGITVPPELTRKPKGTARKTTASPKAATGSSIGALAGKP